MLGASLARRSYGWWLRRRLEGKALPRHIAIIMDGNRRWAREQGYADPSDGHRQGAAHLETVLPWCADLGVDHVTVWVASADNIGKRDPAEVAFLMQLAETTIARHLTQDRSWRVHVVGHLDLLPDSTVRALKAAEESTRNLTDVGGLTIAIGYSGRQEVVESVRAVLDEAAREGRSLREVAATISVEDIAQHLSTPAAPYPDLVIRTSGEQRMSDFLLWQTAKSDLCFVDAYWPALRQIDLLRAVRTFAERHQ